MIDLQAKHLREVVDILSRHVPTVDVWAYGSRVKGTTKPWSDLDLVVMGPTRLESRQLFDLQEAFEESSLPFRVEILDWNAISAEFQAIISSRYEVIKPAVEP
ncbi:nucleotidyltransferase family protein [Desulfoluna spongiiphila]|uniref:nucleotidyltransferase family protein n=1 Tax=Desulfoluna spongiiphila TaxID=419481 RepID=UPI0012518C8C|nr:nucleotidyltransferase domain-containing protein [Desulfoluna spongiiphila]VVS92886.1 polymerase nucleotidyl transferase domain [Desulfoluna spongiiphila]